MRELPRRKQNRLKGYDYQRPGCYFITICANQRAELFWDMVAENSFVGAACGRPPLSVIGLCVLEEIRNLTQIYDALTVDKYVIMPNHIHMILQIHRLTNGRPQAAPTIERAVNKFKGAATKKAGFPIWQKGYHDHIIRSEADYRRIWEYIDTNPAKWREDCYYKDGSKQMAKEEKTNVMRVLEHHGIPYTPHTYDPDGGLDGVSVAKQLGQDPACVFKTLVARGASNGIYVFDIPVAETLDLKKAAKAVGEKSIAMIPQKELLPLTGYVHGGCSPVGMKKQYPTVFDETAELFDTLCVSAGKIGFQVELSPAALLELVGASTADLTSG